MLNKSSITPDVLRQLLVYDPVTGMLFWRPRDRGWFNRDWDAMMWNSRWANEPALTGVDADGYLYGSIFGYNFFAHRAGWMIETGRTPDSLDHINGEKDDNRLVNLREATVQDNARNMRRRADNTSGVTGVSWHKGARKWKAEIVVTGRTMHLGLFSDFQDAAAARRRAEKDIGFHPNHGR
jgi:hypothetical protein